MNCPYRRVISDLTENAFDAAQSTSATYTVCEAGFRGARWQQRSLMQESALDIVGPHLYDFARQVTRASGERNGAWISKSFA
jgi:hypothetical protein